MTQRVGLTEILTIITSLRKHFNPALKYLPASNNIYKALETFTSTLTIFTRDWKYLQGH
jgi:hypothetical protein